MTDFDDDIPPLEDMSEVLEQVHNLRGSSHHTMVAGPIQREPDTFKTTDPTLVQTKDATCDSKANDACHKNVLLSHHNTSTSSFGGMKKGFLFRSSSKTKPKSTEKLITSANTKLVGSTSKNSAKDIPFIKPKEKQHQIQEVQEALKTNTPFLQSKEWVTDDFLQKLEKHPRLLRQLANPRITQAVAKFQENPQLAMHEYKDIPEVLQFFKDFSGLLGEHFESFGRDIPQPSPVTSTSSILTHDSPGPDISVCSTTNPKQATAADEAKMKEILTDTKVQDALRDPEIQRLFSVLKSDPDQAQRLLQQLGPSGKEKVKRLVDIGLLGFSSS